MKCPTNLLKSFGLAAYIVVYFEYKYQDSILSQKVVIHATHSAWNSKRRAQRMLICVDSRAAPGSLPMLTNLRYLVFRSYKYICVYS